KMYDIKALIGHGSFSRVVHDEHRCTRQPFAIKLLEVKGREGHDVCQVELRVLRRVNYSNIIRLAEVFETQHQVYFVLELATGGELLERVVTRGTFREQDSTKALMMLSSGVCYLHMLGDIHRETRKPIQLLGCSAEYLAPEMLARRPCSSTVDIWALGVITYILLSILPFDHSSQPRLFRAILRGSYSFHGDVSVTCFYNTCHSMCFYLSSKMWMSLFLHENRFG
uniref:Si:ch211-27e6.1 n=1 Tax=Cyprinus carpio TaxID=7962 RepID=A0A8C1PJ72_CYPCA